jgi:hypothetical protein
MYKQLLLWGPVAFIPILMKLAISSRKNQDERTLLSESSDLQSVNVNNGHANRNNQNNNNNNNTEQSSNTLVRRLILTQRCFKDNIKSSLIGSNSLFERCVRTGLIMNHKNNCMSPECFCHHPQDIFDPSTHCFVDFSSECVARLSKQTDYAFVQRSRMRIQCRLNTS